MAAADTFLEIKDAPGESTDKQYPNTIEVHSWSFGGSNPVNLSSQTSGAAAGKVDFSDFNFTARLSKASSKMFLAMCNGTHFADVILHCRKATGQGGQVEYLTVSFKQVYVASYSTGGTEGDSERPMESWSLVAGAYKMDYKMQKGDGAIDSNPVTTSWSRIKNDKTFTV